MAKFIGRLVRLGVGKETSRGTGVAPSIWYPQVSLNVGVKVDEVREIGALGSLADSDSKLVAEKYAEGEVSGELRDKSIGYFLYALLGACSSSGPTDSAYTHAFSLSETNQHTSLSLSVKESTLASEIYEMAMLNSFEINAELGGLVQFTAGFTSKAPQPTNTLSPSNTAENKFSKKHVKVRVATDVSSLAAATDLDIKSLRLTFNKNVERDSVLGTVQPIDILNKSFSIEGTISLNYEDNTWRNYMVNGDHKAMRIVINNTDTLIGSSSTPSLTIILPKVDFSGWTPDRSLDEIVKQTINFKANYDLTNGIISTCSLVNAQVSY